MLDPNRNRSPRRDRGENPHGDASFLYIRYKEDPMSPDTGARPSGGLPPNTIVWASPDIVFTPTDALGNVQAGTSVTIRTRIFNGGNIDALGVFVEFWWFNPSFAFTAAPPSQRIGTKIVTVPRLSYLDVVCPVKWTPQFVNGGHECLVVQCSSPSEGADDLKFPFAAALDRHVAQRNLTVVSAQQGQNLQIRVGNPFRTTERFTIHLASLIVTGNMADLRARDRSEALGFMAGVTTHPPQSERGGIPRLTAEDAGGRNFEVRLARSDPAEPEGAEIAGLDHTAYIATRARSAPDFDPDVFGRTLAEVELRPGEVRIMDFELPTAAVGSDRFLVHHFTQVTDGCDIGGYSVVATPAGF
jgi:hypothetical protein